MDQKMLARNKKALMKSLAAAGVDRVEVTYSGGGDEGSIGGATLLAADGTLVNPVAGSVRFERKSWNTSSSSHIDLSLIDAAEDLAGDCLQVTHGGWYNGDGAEGTVRISVATGEIEIEHTEFYTDSRTSSSRM